MTTTAVDQKSGLLRALSVIKLLAHVAPQTMGVSHIARELDLPKAVTHRILKEFTTAGFLVFEEATKQYHLGPSSLTLGLAALRSLDVPRIAHPHLQRMVATTGETATLSVRIGWSRVYVDQVLSPHEIRMSIALGTSHPLYAGSSSKAILAHLSAAEIELYLAQQKLEPVTPATITDLATLRAELAHVAEVGFAVSRGERQFGAGSVAAPIFDAMGSVVGSISVCGPIDRFSPALDEYAKIVVHTARLVSEDLGHSSTDRLEDLQ